MSELTRRRVRIAMVFAPIVLALFIAWNERTALFPFLLGVAIAYVIAPAVNWIAAVMPWRRRDPYLARGLAILVLYATVAGVGTGLGFLFVPQAIDEIQQFSDSLPDTIDAVQERIQDWYDQCVPGSTTTASTSGSTISAMRQATGEQASRPISFRSPGTRSRSSSVT
jgi:predicted PurR-regulated permease PerM